MVVDGPEAEGIGLDFDAEADGFGAGGVMSEEVPGEDALGLEVAPLEVAVAAFPVVAEIEGGGGELVGPAEDDAGEGLRGRGDEDGELVGGAFEAYVGGAGGG